MRPDVEEFFCGISFDAYRLLGSHPAGPGRGWLFTLWAPHARRVQLLGDWNGWDLYSAAELTFCEDGLWRGRVPQAQLGQLYKYNIQGPDGSWQLRADPFAFAFEALPGTASRRRRRDRFWCGYEEHRPRAGHYEGLHHACGLRPHADRARL